MNRKQQINTKSECGPPNKRPRERVEEEKFTNRLAEPIEPLGFNHKDPGSGNYTDVPIVSNRPVNFIRCEPSKANAKDRVKAKRILTRHIKAPITEAQASSKQDFYRIQEDVNWAKAVLPNFRLDYKESLLPVSGTARENLIVKLQMPSQDVSLSSSSLDSLQPPTPTSRIGSTDPNPTNTCGSASKKSFTDIARGRKIIGIIDNANVEGKIPRNQWYWIQASLASITLEVLRDNPGPPPCCQDAGWFQGNTKLIACDNDRSALLYQFAVAKLGEVYPGAQLEVVDIIDIPSRPWATAWLPETPSESAEILGMLNDLNPELVMDSWKVIKADKFERNMMLVIFQVTHASIEYLTMCDGLLNYGFNKIRMQFYMTPQDALSNLEAFAAAVDPPTEEDELEFDQSLLNEDLSFLADYRESLD